MLKAENVEIDERLEEEQNKIILQDISQDILNEIDEVLKIIFNDNCLDSLTKEDLARICEKLQVLLTRRDIQIDNNISMM